MGPSNQALQQAAIDAAAVKAVAEAQIELPDLPGDCYVDTAHTKLVEGAELAVLLRLERYQVDLANDKRYACAKFHDDLKSKISNGNAKNGDE